MIVKTLDQLFNEILTNKDNYATLIGLTNDSVINDNQTLLSELTSENEVARWIHISRLVAESEYNLQSWIKDASLEFTQLISDNGISGNLEWISYFAKKFQTGDIVICDETTDFKPTYNPVNTGNQVVKNCTAEYFGDKVRLKISPILTSLQLTEFKAYMDRIKFNKKYIYVNKASDKLKLIATVIYDGQSNLSTIKSDVENAINNYISNISFDSFFYTNFLIDAIQKVSGVFNIELSTIESRTNEEQSFTPIVDKVNSSAGYFSIDDNYPLSTYLTYKVK